MPAVCLQGMMVPKLGNMEVRLLQSKMGRKEAVMFAWLKDFFGQDVFTGDASCPGLEETGDINPA
ncbi:MAG: hypothetical protein D6698_15330, partial [Gammaproteobacteria bacterium]